MEKNIMAKDTKRFRELQDSFIRAEGAEAFVRAHLMLEYGIITSMASRNMPDYDVIAHNLLSSIDCKISVKYRKAKNSDGFRFRRTSNFKIFVGILGNRGIIGEGEKLDYDSLDPKSEVYVLTLREVAALKEIKGKDIILSLSKIKNDRRYLKEKRIIRKDRFKSLLKLHKNRYL
jgi:hypothetical protein